jgi:hypothetical protein
MPDIMNITVTARNHLVYFADIDKFTTGARPHLSRIWFSDTLSGNRDGRLSRSEHVDLRFIATNFGDMYSRNVSVLARAPRDLIEFTSDSVINIGRLNTGEFYTSSPGFSFQVLPAAIAGASIPFTLLVCTPTDTFEYEKVSPVVIGAQVILNSYVISDPLPGGNSDGIISGGEVFSVAVSVKNTGSSTAYDIRGTFTTDEHFYITDRTLSLDSLAPGQERYFRPLVVSASPVSEDSCEVHILFSASGSDNRISTFSCSDTIKVDFIYRYLRTVGPDAYGYYMYDNLDTTTGQAPVYSWMDISSVGANWTILSSSDNRTVPVTVPFTYKFYGEEYDVVSVSTDGFVSPGVRTGVYSNCIELPSLAAPKPLIAVAWTNLNPSLA